MQVFPTLNTIIRKARLLGTDDPVMTLLFNNIHDSTRSYIMAAVESGELNIPANYEQDVSLFRKVFKGPIVVIESEEELRSLKDQFGQYNFDMMCQVFLPPVFAESDSAYLCIYHGVDGNFTGYVPHHVGNTDPLFIVTLLEKEKETHANN